MNNRPYESTSRRRMRRNLWNERAILAAGICAFISSFFANLATSANFNYAHLFLAPLLVFLYLLLYWLYGKCYARILNSSKLSRLFFSGYYREDITHVVAETIPTDLYHLLVDLKCENDGKELLIAKAYYEIANILDYLSENSDSLYVDYEKTSDPRQASEFVSIVTLDAVFKGIDIILTFCEESSQNNKESNNKCKKLQDRSSSIYNRFHASHNIQSEQ